MAMNGSISPFGVRLAVACLGVAAVAIAARPVPPPTELSFYYSTDAAGVLEPLINDFNGEHEGSIRIAGESVPSGDAVDDIVNGEAEPDLWMPAASMWGALLNERAGAALAPEESPSFFWSPEVFATWPDKSGDTRNYLGWSWISHYTQNATASADFWLGHTKPTKSTSGLYALIGEFEAAARQEFPSTGEQLSPSVVQDDDVQDAVKDIENTVIHYGDIGKDFCPIIEAQGPEYVTAVYLQETVYLACRAEQSEDLPRWHAVYPEEGTYAADYPLYVLQGAWTIDTRDEASTFVDWLGGAITEEEVLDAFLRPGDPGDDAYSDPPSDPWRDVQPPAEADLEILVDPVTDNGATLDAIQAAWPNLQKPANIEFVLDTSFYMADVSEDARTLICDVSENLSEAEVRGDEIGVIAYGQGHHLTTVPLSTPPEPLSTPPKKEDCIEDLRGLPVQAGTTAFPEALLTAVETHEKEPETIDTVIVLSYGADESASPTELDELCGRLEDASAQVITVSFAESRMLERLSYCSGAPAFKVWREYTGDSGMQHLAEDLTELL
jgi:hypothetical protein